MAMVAGEQEQVLEPQQRGGGALEPKKSCDPEDARRPLSDNEVLYAFDEFLYHGEVRDFVKAQHSYERISSSLGTDDFDALIPPCLEVLEFSNHFIRNDTLLCLMYISLGCTLCDVSADVLAPSMRKNATVLAKHDAMPMLVRSLDFLLGHDTAQVLEEGMLEREFRLVFNCIYLQLLFSRHDESFVHGLELGQGHLGASLISLLFEATKMSAENDKIPIKKVVLSLLLVLQCLLGVPDSVLSPSLGPDPSPAPGTASPSAQAAGTAAAGAPSKPPQLRDFQAFAALHLHERCVRQKYGTCGRPAAIDEGLAIIQRYEDDFIRSYAFHPAEVSFMQTTEFLQDAHERYEELAARGAAVKQSAARPPQLPPRTAGGGTAAAVEGLGTLEGEVSGAARARAHDGPEGDELDTSASDSDRGAFSDASSDASAATVLGPDGSEPGEHGSTEDPVEGAGLGSGPRPAPAGERSGSIALQGVDLSTDPMSPEPSAVFHRLFMSIFPCLTETVVFLLRLLLTSCSNVENYPGVVDMARERHVTALGEEEGTAESQFLAFFEKAMPDEAAEAQRHREIMAAAVSGIVLILLKQARRSASEQFSSLAQLITDSNGALVVLKFLNQDLSAAMEPRDSPPVLPCLQVVVAAGGLPGEGGRPPSWPACATLRLLEVLYLLCKDSPERVRKYLIHYKAPFILKRLHRIEHRQVQRLVLKLLRKQVRYLPRKWKQTNMKAISAMYTVVPMSPLEDWLLNEPFLYERLEGPSQADVRASNTAYNVALMRSLSSGAGPSAGGLAGQQSPGAGLGPPATPREGELGLQAEAAEHHLPDAGASLPASTSGLAAAPAAWQQSWPPRAAQTARYLSPEPIGDEALGYAQLFPEYVPACCR